MNFQMFKLDLEKVEESEINSILNIGKLIIEKAREYQTKIFTSALLIMPKPLTVGITTNGGKFFKRWEYQTT